MVVKQIQKTTVKSTVKQLANRLAEKVSGLFEAGVDYAPADLALATA